MPSAINDPIDPRLAGAELHIVSTHGSRVRDTNEETIQFQASQPISPEDDTKFARVALTKFQFVNGLYNLTGNACIMEFYDEWNYDDFPEGPAAHGMSDGVGFVKIQLPEGYYRLSHFENGQYLGSNQTLADIMNNAMNYYFNQNSVSYVAGQDYWITLGGAVGFDLINNKPIYGALGGSQFLTMASSGNESSSNACITQKMTLFQYRHRDTHTGKWYYKITLPNTSTLWYDTLQFPQEPNAKTYSGYTSNDTWVSQTELYAFTYPTQNIFVGMSSIPSQIITTYNYQPNIIGRIPVRSLFGEKQVWQEHDPFFIEVRNPTMHGFVVSLYDDNMQPLNNHGYPWTMSLYFDYVDIVHPHDKISGEDAMHTAYIQPNPFRQDPLLRRKDFMM